MARRFYAGVFAAGDIVFAAAAALAVPNYRSLVAFGDFGGANFLRHSLPRFGDGKSARRTMHFIVKT